MQQAVTEHLPDYHPLFLPARGIGTNERNSGRLTFHLLLQLCSQPRYPESQKTSGQSKHDRSHHQRTDSSPLLSLSVYLFLFSSSSPYLISSDTSCVPRLSSSLSSLWKSGSLSLSRLLALFCCPPHLCGQLPPSRSPSPQCRLEWGAPCPALKQQPE